MKAMSSNSATKNEFIAESKILASDQVFAQMVALAAYAELLSAKADSILHSVMGKHYPIKCCGEESEKMEEFPSLFSAYREKLMDIDSNLKHIEECLDRCELPRN